MRLEPDAFRFAGDRRTVPWYPSFLATSEVNGLNKEAWCKDRIVALSRFVDPFSDAFFFLGNTTSKDLKWRFFPAKHSCSEEFIPA
jgi:hypothetical protein